MELGFVDKYSPRIIKFEELSKAILLAYMGEMDKEYCDEISDLVLNHFGYENEIGDVPLTSDVRDVFNALEDRDILISNREETTLYDGREWRVHSWNFNKDLILKLASGEKTLLDLHNKKISAHDKEDISKILEYIKGGCNNFNALEWSCSTGLHATHNEKPLKSFMKRLEKMQLLENIPENGEDTYFIKENYFYFVKTSVCDLMPKSKDILNPVELKELTELLRRENFRIDEEKIKELIITGIFPIQILSSEEKKEILIKNEIFDIETKLESKLDYLTRIPAQSELEAKLESLETYSKKVDDLKFEIGSRIKNIVESKLNSKVLSFDSHAKPQDLENILSLKNKIMNPPKPIEFRKDNSEKYLRELRGNYKKITSWERDFHTFENELNDTLDEYGISLNLARKLIDLPKNRLSDKGKAKHLFNVFGTLTKEQLVNYMGVDDINEILEELPITETNGTYRLLERVDVAIPETKIEPPKNELLVKTIKIQGQEIPISILSKLSKLNLELIGELAHHPNEISIINNYKEMGFHSPGQLDFVLSRLEDKIQELCRDEDIVFKIKRVSY